MLPDFIPAYGVRPFLGLAVNGVLCLLCAILWLTQSGHRPLRSLTLFYACLSGFFFGYLGYSYQGDYHRIIWLYRIMLISLAWAPFSWVWFISDLWNKGRAPLFMTSLLFAIVASLALLAVEHPAVLGGPLRFFEVGGVLRPQSWLFRPVIHSMGVVVVAISIYAIYFRLWLGPKRPAFLHPIAVGLAIWMLGGLHDALYSWGMPTLFNGTILWLGSVWLSVCLAMATALYFRHLMEANRRLEGNLRQAERLSALGALADGVAHDFNNILQAASSCLELMRGDERLYPEGRAYLKELDDTLLMRGAELVRRMMAFSRKMEPKAGPVDLNQEVSNAGKVLERTLPRNVQVERHLAPGLPPVFSDALGLQQALFNLGSNAADAMPGGGTLRLETELVKLGGDEAARFGLAPGPCALLRVRDTGQGMSPETAANAFKPFFTTKPEGKGTGLGLASVQSTVHRYGGHIELTSGPGLGTTFDIYLPLAKETGELPVEEQEAPTAAPLQEAGILLVDDEAAVLLSAAAYLQKFGYLVLTAVNGEEALDVLGRNHGRIDLVILDLAMPTMDGLSCLEQIHERHPKARVLITSGYSLTETALREVKEKTVGFLPKPFPLSLLLVRVRNILSERDEYLPQAPPS